MKTNDMVADKTGQRWRVVAVFSDGNSYIEHFRARKPTDPPDVFGGLVSDIKPQTELTIVRVYP